MSQATDQAIAKFVQINRHAADVVGSVNAWYYRRQPSAGLNASCRWSAAVGPRRDRWPGDGAVLVNSTALLPLVEIAGPE